MIEPGSQAWPSADFIQASGSGLEPNRAEIHLDESEQAPEQPSTDSTAQTPTATKTAAATASKTIPFISQSDQPSRNGVDSSGIHETVNHFRIRYQRSDAQNEPKSVRAARKKAI